VGTVQGAWGGVSTYGQRQLATVLALDNDTLHLELLTFLLKQEGHRVHATSQPEIALEIVESSVIELVIVDPSLPRHDGHRLCQQIRKLDPYTPLMILSDKSDEEHVVRGLLGAADDYVIKPFSPHSFLARVHALIRRGALSRGARWPDESMAIGEINLNLQQMHAVVNGTVVRLTPRELTLLHALMDNSNRVLSRDQLMRLAWGDDFLGVQKTVDVCVQRLRKKMQPHLQGASYIQSLRGFGYKFSIDRAENAAAS
jgi:DNA-binding response OmpR family regulator